ncbi:MAG: 16S rRNA (guanine(966)-N(2))-methyltransferase RsmD [Deltaproteobacteria bacterium]|nr:16S rRNA (guanine(966)-N(2))-methyltransferase RsmD [Deltaproteobacteria bacterium]
MLRITGGTLRGRRLCPLKKSDIRPTTDYFKQMIFNILADRVAGSVVLDLFAGTGSLAIEALSRGASMAVLVDNHTQAVKLSARNISVFGLDRQCVVLKRDILKGLAFLKARGRVFDLVFMDPPYDRAMGLTTLNLLERSECLASSALVVVEHSRREPLPEKVGSLEQIRQRGHGNTLVSFYESVV